MTKIFLFQVVMMLCLLPISSVAAENTVKGRIITDSGPFKGAKVYAYTKYEDILAGKPIFVSNESDDQGGYISSIPGGEYYFVARGVRGGKEYFAFPGNNPINVEPGETWIPFLANEMKPPVYASGETAIDGLITYKGVPVDRAVVSVYNPDTKRFKGLGLKFESAGEKGTFSFSMTAGKYVVIAKKMEGGKGIRPMKKGDLYCYYPGNPVEVKQGSVVRIEIPCYPRDEIGTFSEKQIAKQASSKNAANRMNNTQAGIGGKVTSADGKPLAGLLVLAYRATDATFQAYNMSRGTEYSAETDAEGTYFMPIDASGDYYLVARETVGDGPHEGEPYGLYNGNSRHVVTFEKGKKIENINITVARVGDAIPEPLSDKVGNQKKGGHK
jgi:hypothetical protein